MPFYILSVPALDLHAMKITTTLFFVGLLKTTLGGVTYKAAVVEFAPDITILNVKEQIKNNLNGFERVLEDIREQNVQIVVFPEDAIAEFFSVEAKSTYFEDIPEISSQNVINPCLQTSYVDRPILQRLSCLAVKYQTVIVANTGDKVLCNFSFDSQCPRDGMYLYNTDVVFEADGRLIAKYHKLNLFSGERNVFTAGNASNGISFQTNFGVTFGIFTCYDILFSNPSGCLLESGIKNFIFPTSWGNSFPFYMSTAVQQGWSFRNRVNLLAANLHVNFHLGNFYGTGSGIYSAGVAKSYFMTGNEMGRATGQVLISRLFTDPSLDKSKKQVGTLTGVKNINAKFGKYASYRPLTDTKGAVNVSSVCNGSELTCTLNYKFTQGEDEQFALGAYIGNEETGFSGYSLPSSKQSSLEEPGDFSFAVCFITKCDNRFGCGHVNAHSGTVFEYLHLEGSFPLGSKPYSVALANGFELIDTGILKSSNDWTTLSINSPSNILTAGLWTMVGHVDSVCSL